MLQFLITHVRILSNRSYANAVYNMFSIEISVQGTALQPESSMNDLSFAGTNIVVLCGFFHISLDSMFE